MKIKLNEKGLSLIMLTITVIIIIILTTSIIMIGLGPNGIIKSTLKAKEENNISVVKEELNMMFWDYNIYKKYDKLSDFLEAKVASGEIESYKTYPIEGSIGKIIKKNGYYFLIEDKLGMCEAKLLGTDLSNIGEGFTIITEEEFKSRNGTITVDVGEGKESALLLYDEINDKFNIDIVSGKAILYVTQNVELTNEGMDRAAIDIHSGAELNIYVEEGKTLTANSGYGAKGEEANGFGAKGGPGGYAGIHVPEGAVLNLYGEGEIIATGGNAGDGAGAVTGNTGGRWWRWSWCRHRSEMEELADQLILSL